MATIADEQRRKPSIFNSFLRGFNNFSEPGFAAEALVIANAAFEFVVERYLALAVAVDPIAEEKVLKQVHRQHLELIKKIVSAETEPSLQSVEFKEFVSTMFEANTMRNDYLHQLVPPSQDPWKLAELDRIVERVLPFLTDPFRSMITLGCLCQPGWPRQETTLLLLNELNLLNMSTIGKTSKRHE